ncbi:nickel pincer cofactor biosynthesis protein LarC [Streptomyces sp. NPDC051041]|uniref:nickel pincer cofactor biosynthesis protein LarC n=1 Tax=Streptomyces sp. NPDC051041 TaxID=3365640 RepID=UPI0037B1C086
MSDLPGAGGGAPLTAHLDCSTGVAGDMLLGALLAAGARPERVNEAIASLGVPGLAVRAESARRGGLACTRVEVLMPAVADRERHLRDVRELLAGAGRLTPAAAAFALRTFELLADAEAAVHGVGREEVHFHEVGAFDALADVVGCAAALDDLGLLADGVRVTCSALEAGSGQVRGAHGVLPVPVPAVLEIARAHGLPLAGGALPGECTTPTGAALVAALARPGPAGAMRVTAVGCGGGTRELPDRPNVTRVTIGRSSAAPRPDTGGTAGTDEVAVVESTVDDMDPRLWPGVLEALRAAGAWDCWTTPVTARGGRPGRQVTALCPPEARGVVTDVLFAHTCTLGVRWWTARRSLAVRHLTRVAVGPVGDRQSVRVKVSGDGPGRTVQPEFADIARAAAALGWPERAVAQEALRAYWAGCERPAEAGRDPD